MVHAFAGDGPVHLCPRKKVVTSGPPGQQVSRAYEVAVLVGELERRRRSPTLSARWANPDRRRSSVARCPGQTGRRP
jgi:hypothetical protein